ncbi:MAG: hypothetical protein ACQET3_05350 [Promethearchaeati archaeon]
MSHSKDESDEQEELLHPLKRIDNRLDSIQRELSMLSAATVTGLSSSSYCYSFLSEVSRRVTLKYGMSIRGYI